MDCNDKSSEKFHRRSESDFKIEWYSGTGCGGQNRNKIMSSCRLTHLPSGIVVSCQDEKSQLKNKEKALNVLKARLFEKAESENPQTDAFFQLQN